MARSPLEEILRLRSGGDGGGPVRRASNAGLYAQLVVFLVLCVLAIRWILLEEHAPDPLLTIPAARLAIYIVIGVGVLAGWMWFNLAVLINIWWAFAILGAIFGSAIFFFAFYPLIRWLDVAADDSAASRLVVRIVDYVESSPVTYKGARIGGGSGSVKVVPLSGDGKRLLIDESLIWQERHELPPVDAELSMLVHPGLLGMPWASDFSWTPPPPRPEPPPMRRVTEEDLAQLRDRQAQLQQMLETLRAQLDASPPSEGTSGVAGPDAPHAAQP